MWGRLALVLLLFGLFGDEAAEHGRAGNAFYEQRQYSAAESAYRDGLADAADTTGAVYAALQNNLGAALHKQERYAEARTAFQRAVRAAASSTERQRALFNAGTAAAGAGRLRAALADYKEVLLLNPGHDRARYNYEYIKRQLSKQQPRSGSTPDVEPSAYARRLKKKAEALVVETEYAAAAQLLRTGIRKDSTVLAYRDFLRRLEDVAQIAQTP
jgi:tetratricopeptide (TPR) repeat protein